MLDRQETKYKWWNCISHSALSDVDRVCLTYSSDIESNVFRSLRIFFVPLGYKSRNASPTSHLHTTDSVSDTCTNPNIRYPYSFPLLVPIGCLRKCTKVQWIVYSWQTLQRSYSFSSRRPQHDGLCGDAIQRNGGVIALQLLFLLTHFSNVVQILYVLCWKKVTKY